MTKYDLIKNIKADVSHYLSNNKYAKADFKLLSEIYDTIKVANITPDNKFIVNNDKYGYIYENSSIRLSNGCLLFFYSIFDKFVTMRYSGYYPFVIDLDRVNEKIEQIDGLYSLNQP